MCRSGLVNMLVTHANMKGFGLTHLFGDRCGYMHPQVKNKTKAGFQMISNFVSLKGILDHEILKFCVDDPKNCTNFIVNFRATVRSKNNKTAVLFQFYGKEHSTAECRGLSCMVAVLKSKL
jgi:hypothetical protein